VHLEAEAMAGAVEEADGALGRVLGLVAAGREDLDALGVDTAAVDAGADRLERGELRGADGGDERALGVAGLAAEKGARHVPVVTGFADPREDIDDDQLVGAQRTRAALVRVARLVAAGGDGVERDRAGLDARGLDRDLQALAGERAALVDEAAAPDLAGAEHALGGGDARGAAAIAFADRGRAPRRAS